MKQSNNINILIVDDRSENLLVLESLLDNMNCNLMKATSGNEALSLMLENDFALVLLDVQMPEMDGFETAELMRCNSRTRYIPIIFVTAISKEQKCIFKGYEVGAVDYLFKPIESIILQSKVKVFLDLYNQKKLVEEQTELLELKIKELMELKDINYELKNLTMTDGLTGISNRRYFNEYIEKGWKNCLRSGEPISLIMVDIDFFKAYNDNYGHLKGDECLIEVARTIMSNASRPMDCTARYGGEEFAVVLLETDMNGAMYIAEKIRKDIEARMIKHEYSGISSYITISLGITTIIPTQALSIQEFIDKADKGLYKAKTSGRNQISFYD